jgi:hypothetical protein
MRANGATAVGLPWPSLLGFLRLATNPVVVRHPVTTAAAWRQVEEWLDCEPVWVPLAGEAHRSLVAGFLKAP